MIVVSTITSNTSGSIPIRENQIRTTLRDGRARVSRVGTLDGSVVITNNGYAAGDLTFTVAAQISESDADALWALYKTETKLVLACEAGCFYGAIDRLRVDRGNLRLVFLVEDDDSAA